MANMADCMLRNLRHYVEQNLGGIIRWDEVLTAIPVDGEGNVVEIEFSVGNRDFHIRIESSDFNPRHSLGQIIFNGRAMGPIDHLTWAKITPEIRAQAERAYVHV